MEKCKRFVLMDGKDYEGPYIMNVVAIKKQLMDNLAHIKPGINKIMLEHTKTEIDKGTKDHYQFYDFLGKPFEYQTRKQWEAELRLFGVEVLYDRLPRVETIVVGRVILKQVEGAPLPGQDYDASITEWYDYIFIEKDGQWELVDWYNICGLPCSGPNHREAAREFKATIREKTETITKFKEFRDKGDLYRAAAQAQKLDRDDLAQRCVRAQDVIDCASTHPTDASTIRRDTKKIGRNDPCPCGSGKKYKKCCLPPEEI